MENNLLAEIFVAKDKIDDCLAVSPAIEPSYAPGQISSAVSAPESKINVTEPQTLRTPSVTAASSTMDSSMLACAYLVTVEEAVQKETVGSLMGKSKYVVYGLSIRRLIDGVEHKVYHRFRDIKSLYYSLMMEFEDIEYNASIRFPNYEAKWSMSSNQSNNPNSELVVRRRADLQVFFYELFKNYPFLQNHPRVQEFFEMKALHASSVSSFSTHLSSVPVKGGRSSTSTSAGNRTLSSDGKTLEHDALAGYTEKVNNGWVYDASQGRLINTDTWKEVSPAPRQMSYVDFATFNQWYESKTRAT